MEGLGEIGSGKGTLTKHCELTRQSRCFNDCIGLDHPQRRQGQLLHEVRYSSVYILHSTSIVEYIYQHIVNTLRPCLSICLPLNLHTEQQEMLLLLLQWL